MCLKISIDNDTAYLMFFLGLLQNTMKVMVWVVDKKIYIY